MDEKNPRHARKYGRIIAEIWTKNSENMVIMENLRNMGEEDSKITKT